MIQYEWLGVLLCRSGSPGDHGFSDPVIDHESDVLVADCESVQEVDHDLVGDLVGDLIANRRSGTTAT